MKVYFAHPINIYGEPLESAFETLIANALTDGDCSKVENPNQKVHKLGYAYYAERYKNEPFAKGTRGMRYFFEVVLPGCSSVAAVPFLDSRMGLGVLTEVENFLENGYPAWFVSPTRVPTAEDLKEFISNPLCGLFEVRPFTEKELDLLFAKDPSFCVLHEETRLRTWRIYDVERRPYEEAHLVSLPLPEGFYPEKK